MVTVGTRTCTSGKDERDDDTVYDEFHDAVDMTANEIENWLDDDPTETQ